MKFWDAVGALLAISIAPIGLLFLYDIFYDYVKEEDDEVELDEKEGD